MTTARREMFRVVAANIGWVVGPNRHDCYTYWGLGDVAQALGVSCDAARGIIGEWISEGMPHFPSGLEQAAALMGVRN